MIRHGQTQDNKEKIFSRDDTKLTSLGIEQIKNTKKHLKDVKFTKVFYSPLTRTRESIKHLELEGVPDARIQEVNFGVFTGKNYHTILKEFPRETQMWVDDPIGYCIPEGESLEMVYDRLKDFLEEMKNKEEDVLLITHEGIIRLVCCWVFDNIEYFFKFKSSTGSLNIVSIVDDYKYISKLNYNAK